MRRRASCRRSFARFNPPLSPSCHRFSELQPYRRTLEQAYESLLAPLRAPFGELYRVPTSRVPVARPSASSIPATGVRFARSCDAAVLAVKPKSEETVYVDATASRCCTLMIAVPVQRRGSWAKQQRSARIVARFSKFVLYITTLEEATWLKCFMIRMHPVK